MTTHPFRYIGCFIDKKAFHALINGVRERPLEREIKK